ncbi:MAG: T9SS type A sorting domain-containing protein [Bacteroidales bacterium]|jgi:hypothetical protein|nr:T9SS type A sorting domain-containing protein [Bacteroidales bacterium]
MKTLTCFIVSVFLAFVCFSQTELQVVHTDNSLDNFSVEEEATILFENGNFIINNSVVSPVEIAITDIRKIVFPINNSLSAITNAQNKPFIYPNPVTNQLHIENMSMNNATEIKIFNDKGQLLLSKTITLSHTIDVSSLPVGLYFLKINDVTLKFVKL